MTSLLFGFALSDTHITHASELHDWLWHTRGRALRRTEQRLSRAARGDSVRCGIRLALVRVARAPDTTLKRETRSLLDDVRGFVGGESHIRLAAERDAIADREGTRAEPRSGFAGVTAHRGMHMPDVMRTERRLDPFGVGQLRGRSTDAGQCGLNGWWSRGRDMRSALRPNGPVLVVSRGRCSRWRRHRGRRWGRS